jgi:predicted dehydrogenase
MIKEKYDWEKVYAWYWNVAQGDEYVIPEDHPHAESLRDVQEGGIILDMSCPFHDLAHYLHCFGMPQNTTCEMINDNGQLNIIFTTTVKHLAVFPDEQLQWIFNSEHPDIIKHHRGNCVHINVIDSWKNRTDHVDIISYHILDYLAHHIPNS